MGASRSPLAACGRSLGALRQRASLVNLHADTAPLRPAGHLPIHPYADRVPDQVLFRYEPDQGDAAVRAVIAVVAHEEIAACGHYGVIIDAAAIGREHDHMRFPAKLLEFKR